MNVLVITTREEALQRGANLITCHHRSSPEILFWWPALGKRALEGRRRFDLIIRDSELELPEEFLAWVRAGLCSAKETLWVEAKEIGGCVLLERT
jgi:1-acyl-sn-glycerol-3-phosphate acyltransferase